MDCHIQAALAALDRDQLPLKFDIDSTGNLNRYISYS
jgi:hypothetical protein